VFDLPSSHWRGDQEARRVSKRSCTRDLVALSVNRTPIQKCRGMLLKQLHIALDRLTSNSPTATKGGIQRRLKSPRITFSQSRWFSLDRYYLAIVELITIMLALRLSRGTNSSENTKRRVRLRNNEPSDPMLTCRMY
jgi:hypothetical protein